MIILLLSLGTAHEFLHSFAGHKDTVHTLSDTHAHAAQIEKVHIHCKVLDVSIPAYIKWAETVFTANPVSIFDTGFAIAELSVVYRFIDHSHPRGPPDLLPIA